ncbi:hypothetical protein [Spiroplasma endosymbiont of Ammophila pubescens]|uniref:hypothetical protein n=1 Tax=Spiroplasma endosymbiont of Ammophila pubescens TaxID=3066315 RepID=UPI0032B2158F
MAQKEQKFNKYDQELKNQIIQEFYLSHYSYKIISIKYSIPIGTLQYELVIILKFFT